MGIVRLLLIIGIAWVVITLLRRHFASRPVENRPLRDVRTVRCAQCGVHVPEPEAVRSGGHDYCTMEHRNLGPRRD